MKKSSLPLVLVGIATFVGVLGLIYIGLYIYQQYGIMSDAIMQGYAQADINDYLINAVAPQIMLNLAQFIGLSTLIFAAAAILKRLVVLVPNPEEHDDDENLGAKTYSSDFGQAYRTSYTTDSTKPEDKNQGSDTL